MPRPPRQRRSRLEHQLPLLRRPRSAAEANSAAESAPAAVAPASASDPRRALAEIFELAAPVPDPAFIREDRRPPLGPPIEDRLPPRPPTPRAAVAPLNGSRLPAALLSGVVLLLLLVTVYLRNVRTEFTPAASPAPPQPAANKTPQPSPQMSVAAPVQASTPRPSAAESLSGPIIQDLRSAESWIRRARAARRLGQLGAVEAVPALMQTLLGDADWAVRALAADALADLGSPAQAREALEAARQQDAEELVRSAAANALQRAPQAISAGR